MDAPIQAPGTWRTWVVVWDVRDPTKEGDARYSWSADEVGRLLRVTPARFASTVRQAGTPKGRSLASYREEFAGGEAVFGLGGPGDEWWKGLEQRPVQELPEGPRVTHRLSLSLARRRPGVDAADAEPHASVLARAA